MRPDPVIRVPELIRTADGLPLPGSGATIERWRWLRERAAEDVVTGRLVEAHLDADAIVAELTGERLPDGQWWGVWAAEPPRPVVTGRRVSGTPDGGTPELLGAAGGLMRLDGAKPWCSGAGMCTHALLTVRDADDPQRRWLCAVALDQPGVTVDTSGWIAAGMARSATGTVTFKDVAATIVAPGSAYLERAGFWHGGCQVAACWLGGADAVARRLRDKGRPDEIGNAHLGAVDAALAGAGWALEAAAVELERAPHDIDAARIRALRVRTIIEAAAALTLERVGRALGPGPLAHDEGHAAAVADLSVYIRQHHGERDLAFLGESLREH